MWKRISLIVVLLVAAVILLRPYFDRPEEQTVQADLVSRASGASPEGFARADGPRAFRFPEDFGPHEDFQTEWWYYTGNLESDTGEHFGYQLTFFRRALTPPGAAPERESRWAAEQVYMAHFALSDVAGADFLPFERLARGSAGLAGAQASPYQVWLEDWRVEEVSASTVRLQAEAEAETGETVAIDLELTDLQGPVLQGDQGYSRKGPEPGQASYYFSQVQLATQGEVQSGGERFTVEGMSWMDHEFSTSALAGDQVGWDWFALQFDDGSALMVFQIRNADGSPDPYSAGAWITPQGESLPLSLEDFSLDVQDTWKSPHSQAVYPSGWDLRVPALDLALQIEPYQKDQELNLSYSYWEGAVRIQGAREGEPLSGSGYAELTGYAQDMGGEF